MAVNAVTVFCGASPGHRPGHRETAADLGLPLVCDITAKPVGDAEAYAPEFWVRELREPAQFADAANLLAQDGVTTYLELGPGEVLAGMLGNCLPSGDTPPVVLATALDWRLCARSTRTAGDDNCFAAPPATDVG